MDTGGYWLLYSALNIFFFQLGIKKDVTLLGQDFSKYNLWSKTNEVQETICCAPLQKEKILYLAKGIMQSQNGDSTN